MKRDIAQELLQSIKDIKEGKGKKRHLSISSNVTSIRQQLSLSQFEFASLMGVSQRTLQEWEQGRRKPSGPASSLLRIASKHPEVFADL